jgi:alpha-L-rhamnosidase
MKILILFVSLLAINFPLYAAEWKAGWISHPDCQNATNTWLSFRKELNLNGKPVKAPVRIAADSKYWLWINGELVVFEGGVKRGPTPVDTYFDELDIAPFLAEGKNSIAILVWYFGKDGFSHKSSGKAGLLFQGQFDHEWLLSDNTWITTIHPSYESTGNPHPNFRLPESNIRYDARTGLGDWTSKNYHSQGTWKTAKEFGIPPVAPWNDLYPRLIPQWKNFGLKEYANQENIPPISDGRPIVCKLPANIHITPYLEIDAPAGTEIRIQTDNYMGGGPPNVRSEYVAKEGLQEYESLGWMNGHHVIYTIPAGVIIKSLKYRETGFDTEFAGSFYCSDSFFNKLWQKAQRTLYVTMRDTYMDCPDRERAQWWGDEVIEAEEAFYALCPQSHSLFRKGIYELINWQRNDSTLFSPVPAGNWDVELPCQMLASIGYYGFWNYYLHTGDLKTIADAYEGAKKYLAVWKIKENGTLQFRPGDWTWGDWGIEKDMELLENGWYYLALKGLKLMAAALDKPGDAEYFDQAMNSFKSAFNHEFWTGSAYRHPEYQGQTDDRVQALAVIAGLADPAKYNALLEVFKTSEFASPYMEKYVMEALFVMGEDVFALERAKRKFGKMVNHPEYTTLWEGWGIGNEGYGGGTINHAWSGGGLTVLSQKVCGIAPLAPGYEKIRIAPQPAGIEKAEAKILSVKGEILSAFSSGDKVFELNVAIPASSVAVIVFPKAGIKNLFLNRKLVFSHDNHTNRESRIPVRLNENQQVEVEVNSGEWNFKAEY